MTVNLVPRSSVRVSQPKLHILKPPAFDLIDLLPALEREVLRLLIT